MSELVVQALDLVLYGMGSVFVFLTMLVGATMLMSKLVGGEIATEPARSSTPANPQAVDPKTLAAIGAAVKQYRSGR